MSACPPGQFYQGIEYEVTDLRPGEVPEKPDATMFVKGQELNVTRYMSQISVPRHRGRVWMQSLSNRPLLCKHHFVCMTFLPWSTEAGRETSGETWRSEKMFPAGSFTVTEQASSTEMQQTTLCQDFSKPLKRRLHISVKHRTHHSDKKRY